MVTIKSCFTTELQNYKFHTKTQVIQKYLHSKEDFSLNLLKTAIGSSMVERFLLGLSKMYTGMLTQQDIYIYFFFSERSKKE